MLTASWTRGRYPAPPP